MTDEMTKENLIDSSYFEWRDGRAFWKIVAATTFWHHKEHTEQIDAWADSLSAEEVRP